MAVQILWRHCYKSNCGLCRVCEPVLGVYKTFGSSGWNCNNLSNLCNWNMGPNSYPAVCYNQTPAVLQEQCSQYAAARQMVSAIQPNGPTFTSLGQKVLCKSSCSPSISFTPIGHNTSVDKASVVSQHGHSHNPQLSSLSCIRKLWKMFWHLYTTISCQWFHLVTQTLGPLCMVIHLVLSLACIRALALLTIRFPNLIWLPLYPFQNPNLEHWPYQRWSS